MATSVGSKNSNRGLAIDRPFADDVVRRAAEVVPRYQVVIRWSPEDDGYAGHCIEMPNAIGFGITESECVAEVRGNLSALVMYALESGETPPLADRPLRNTRVSVSFADYERATAQALADAAGKSLSDYIRTAALRGTALS